MTPTQLRAFAAVVRLGSVKQAAAELEVTEAAVSLHIAQLRKELGDRLFTRTSAGLAFTPGGLRLAGRAIELLGLADRTVREVSQAGGGRRLLRIAATSMFAEHAAPGLIELFAGRADDLDVELSVHASRELTGLLLARSVDVAIGPRSVPVDGPITATPFLNYQVVAVAAPEHPLVRVHPSVGELQAATWLLGPSAAEQGTVAALLQRLSIPEDHQQIFQSHAAAIEEAKRGHGVAPTVGFAVAEELNTGRLKRVSGALPQPTGSWTLYALDERGGPQLTAELRRFVTTPRATQAMLRGAGVTLGRFRPSIHVTLWS